MPFTVVFLAGLPPFEHSVRVMHDVQIQMDFDVQVSFPCYANDYVFTFRIPTLLSTCSFGISMMVVRT